MDVKDNLKFRKNEKKIKNKTAREKNLDGQKCNTKQLG